MVAWLPSHKEGPSPSSPLIGEAPAAKGAYPAPWIVVAVALEGDVRDALLAHCAARRTEGQNLLDTGIVIGDDLAFFAEAALFAWSLAAAQRFLPTAVRTPEGLRHAGARSLPVRMPSDSTTWQRPCRASSTADADTGRAARGVAFRAVRSSGSLLRQHDQLGPSRGSQRSGVYPFSPRVPIVPFKPVYDAAPASDLIRSGRVTEVSIHSPTCGHPDE
jgi:hypothetical protein